MTAANREHSMGGGGSCICPKCKTIVAHRSGVRCQDEHCPQCHARMLRVGSRHHELWMKKQSA